MMAFDMMNSPSSGVSNMRSDYDLPNNATNPSVATFSFKGAYSLSGRPPSSLTLAEQAELEYELRYRGNMIVDQQRKIQLLEDELRQARDQMEMMNNQLTSYEQDRGKDKKKPQSRYWTPEEHQRFLEALQKFGHKDVKSISLHVATRNATQVRTHAQKYFLRLERERRKKEDFGGSPGDGYNSSSSLDDMGSNEHSGDDGGDGRSASISSLTIPGSPAVSMMSDVVGTPPGTPGDNTPGSPLAASSSSPIPRRRRATSFITVAQARLAAQARESVLVGLPPTWVVEDYDMFMKGLLALADKQDDISSLCRAIREQYLPQHSPDEVELCYRNVLKNIKQKPLIGSPKRRRTNSRPEPLMSTLNASVAFAPSFPAPPNSSVGASFPFRNMNHNLTSQNANNNHSPSNNNNSHSLQSSYGSNSPPSHSSSPLGQAHQQMSSPHTMRSSPYAEYSPLELPILSDLNISGLSTIGGGMGHMQNSSQQQQQAQAQQFSGLSPNSINPWGTSLPFSFDALMSGNVALPQSIPLVSHN